jgi:hypothetical protein
MTTGGKIGLASVVTGVILALFIGSFFFLAANRFHDVAGTAKCASNLHQIGLALQLYMDANHGQFPRTFSDDSDEPKPNWGTPYQSNSTLGPVAGANRFKHQDTTPFPNDVTASLFLLVRETQLQSYAFICPDSAREPWDYGGGNCTANDWTNWQGNAGLLAHLSYSFQNPFISRQAIDAGFSPSSMNDPMFAVAADMNPGEPAVTSINMHSTSAELKLANSHNHHSEGQNVLYGDGHTEWMNNPFCGISHDNIFTAGGPETPESLTKKSAVNASSTGPQDSVLLPTAADLLRH